MVRTRMVEEEVVDQEMVVVEYLEMVAMEDLDHLLVEETEINNKVIVSLKDNLHHNHRGKVPVAVATEVGAPPVNLKDLVQVARLMLVWKLVMRSNK